MALAPTEAELADMREKHKQDMALKEVQRQSSIVEVKQLRVDLDATLQNIRKLNGSREVSLVITKTQEAIMWLGMELKRLGEASPYPNSYKPENTIVDPTAQGLKL